MWMCTGLGMEVECNRCGDSCAKPEDWLHLSDNRDFCKMCTKRLVKKGLEVEGEESIDAEIELQSAINKLKQQKEN